MRSMGIIVDKKNIIMAINLTIGSNTHNSMINDKHIRGWLGSVGNHAGSANTKNAKLQIAPREHPLSRDHLRKYSTLPLLVGR
jgi:hypothetical protein